MSEKCNDSKRNNHTTEENTKTVVLANPALSNFLDIVGCLQQMAAILAAVCLPEKDRAPSGPTQAAQLPTLSPFPKGYFCSVQSHVVKLIGQHDLSISLLPYCLQV